jgi:hypothetical protein
LSNTRPNEEQAGDVDARNEQHATHGPKEHEQGGPKVLVQWEDKLHCRAPPIVCRRIGLFQVSREARNLCLRGAPVDVRPSTRQNCD